MSGITKIQYPMVPYFVAGEVDIDPTCCDQ